MDLLNKLTYFLNTRFGLAPNKLQNKYLSIQEIVINIFQLFTIALSKYNIPLVNDGYVPLETVNRP